MRGDSGSVGVMVWGKIRKGGAEMLFLMEKIIMTLILVGGACVLIATLLFIITILVNPS